MMVNDINSNEKINDWTETVCESNRIVKLGYYDYMKGFNISVEYLNNVVTRYEFGKMCAKNGVRWNDICSLDDFDPRFSYDWTDRRDGSFSFKLN